MPEVLEKPMFAEKLLNREKLATIKLPVPATGAIRTVFVGELDAQGADNRILIRLNKAATNYKSYVLMTGAATTVETETNGFYAGRNGWHLDADIFIDYHISTDVKSKHCGTGQATFALGNGNMLGYEMHGFSPQTPAPITDVTIAVEGPGILNGTFKVYPDLT